VKKKGIEKTRSRGKGVIVQLVERSRREKTDTRGCEIGTSQEPVERTVNGIFSRKGVSGGEAVTSLTGEFHKQTFSKTGRHKRSLRETLREARGRTGQPEGINRRQQRKKKTQHPKTKKKDKVGTGGQTHISKKKKSGEKTGGRILLVGKVGTEEKIFESLLDCGGTQKN